MFRRIAVLTLASPLAFAEDKVTYDDHVLPLFQAACLNCHNPDKSKSGLDLSTYGATLRGGSGGTIAEAGDSGSKLISVVRHTAEPKMPPEGDKLSADQIGVLERWIAGGLLENKGSQARKPAKPKFTSVKLDASGRPDGPPPMPEDLLLDPPVATASGTAVRAMATSPWAPLLAVSSQHQVLLFHTGTLRLEGILPFPEGEPASLSFSPDGRHLVVGGGVPGKSGTTVTFDVTKGTRLLETAREFDSVLAADATSGFHTMVTGGPSRMLKFWDPATGEPVRSIKKHTDWITALDVSPDGVLVASGDRNGGIWVWEAGSGGEFHTLRAHQAGITGLAFRSDSNLLASASEDGTLRFWDMNSGNEVRKIDAHPGGVTAFAFTRDGRSISAGRDRKLKLWKADFGHLRDLAQDLPALPTAVAIDAEGNRAFVADTTGAIRAYQTEDGKPAGELASNPPSIATRLDRLRQNLEAARQEAAREETAREGSRRDLDAAREAVQKAGTRLRQAESIAGAAQADGSPHPDAASKLREHAEKRRNAAAEKVARAKEILHEKEDAHRRTAARAKECSRRTSHIEREIRHWTAAGINTRRIEAAVRAGEGTWQAETLREDFTVQATELAELAETVNRKRSEFTRLSRFATTLPSGSAAATEARATLDAVGQRVREVEADLARRESGFAELRAKVDRSASEAAGWILTAARRSEEYRRALESRDRLSSPAAPGASAPSPSDG